MTMFVTTRRLAILTAVLSGVLASLSSANRAAETLSRKPNVVIILADDLGYGDTSTYGGWIGTPHLDQLAREGVKFTDFHASGNVCSPTRAGLLTGRYQQRAGIAEVINADPKVAAHWHGLQPEEITFAELLGKAGYRTALFGKWHLGYTKNFNPVWQGFDRFRGYVSGNIDYHSHYDRMGVYDWWNGLETVQETGYVTHLITAHAVQFIEENKDRPFCLYIANEAVHSPLQGPNDPPQRGPQAVRKPKRDRGTPPDTKRPYREMMQEMDKGIGEVVAALRRLDLENNTLVFFFSDNGATRLGSNAPLRGFKGSNWEGGHREPAVAWWPGRIRPGGVCRELAISLDLLPTVLDLAGAAPPPNRPLDGVSLLPVLLDGQSLGDRKLFWNGKAMRDGPWKLIVDGRGQEGVGLYNLADDIGEQSNLADRFPQRVQRMLSELEAWRKDVAEGAAVQPEEPPQDEVEAPSSA